MLCLVDSTLPTLCIEARLHCSFVVERLKQSVYYLYDTAAYSSAAVLCSAQISACIRRKRKAPNPVVS